MGLLRQVLLVISLSSCLNLVSAKWEFDWTYPFFHHQDDRHHGHKIVPSSAADFVCEHEGRYPDPEDCSAFYYCSKKSFPVHLSCPSGMKFNPHDSRCSFGYECGSDAATIRALKSSLCVTEGLFRDPYNCSVYYRCIKDAYGGFIKIDYACPGKTVFNPVTKTCSSILPCLVLTPPSTTTTTTSSNSNVILNGDFVCQYKGRFPNPSDCSAYYLCEKDASGNLFLSYMTCPGNLVFNPHSQFCTSPDNYYCEPTITPPTPPPTPTPAPTPEPPIFQCMSAGRFPVADNCSLYYLCEIGVGGTLIQSTRMCPGRSLFNPDISFCDLSYNCPSPTCNADGFLCLSESSFYDCDPNNVPIESVQNCPVGTFCYMNCPLSCMDDNNFC